MTGTQLSVNERGHERMNDLRSATVALSGAWASARSGGVLHVWAVVTKEKHVSWSPER